MTAIATASITTTRATSVSPGTRAGVCRFLVSLGPLIGTPRLLLNPSPHAHTVPSSSKAYEVPWSPAATWTTLPGSSTRAAGSNVRVDFGRPSWPT